MTLNSNLIYMAPLEGITGYIFRNAYDKVFGDIDKYFAPFIASKATGAYKGKELRDILPENNKYIHLVPQILSKDSKDFINLAKIIMDMGYNEINLNAAKEGRIETITGKEFMKIFREMKGLPQEEDKESLMPDDTADEKKASQEPRVLSKENNEAKDDTSIAEDSQSKAAIVSDDMFEE